MSPCWALAPTPPSRPRLGSWGGWVSLLAPALVEQPAQSLPRGPAELSVPPGVQRHHRQERAPSVDSGVRSPPELGSGRTSWASSWTTHCWCSTLRLFLYYPDPVLEPLSPHRLVGAEAQPPPSVAGVGWGRLVAAGRFSPHPPAGPHLLPLAPRQPRSTIGVTSPRCALTVSETQLLCESPNLTGQHKVTASTPPRAPRRATHPGGKPPPPTPGACAPHPAASRGPGAVGGLCPRCPGWR